MTAEQQAEFRAAVKWWHSKPKESRPARTTIVKKLIERGSQVSVSTALKMFDDIARR